jgi:hypothetical protein
MCWVQELTQHLAGGAAYHIARKQIPSKGGQRVAGLKLEMFIFDPFERADRTALVEVGGEGGKGGGEGGGEAQGEGCLPSLPFQGGGGGWKDKEPVGSCTPPPRLSPPAPATPAG